MKVNDILINKRGRKIMIDEKKLNLMKLFLDIHTPEHHVTQHDVVDLEMLVDELNRIAYSSLPVLNLKSLIVVLKRIYGLDNVEVLFNFDDDINCVLISRK